MMFCRSKKEELPENVALGKRRLPIGGLAARKRDLLARFEVFN